MDGILNVNKPAGPTSHDVVARIRRITQEKRVGHAGTLDPMASGVLLVCLGAATRVVEHLVDSRKQYRAMAAFGVTTDTEDGTGETTSNTDASFVTCDLLADVLKRFEGEIEQTPPMVSAVRHRGRRLYELARQGVTVERAPRLVRIYALRLIEFTPGTHPEAVLDVECSKGTYVRTLCADIGKALGTGGHMKSLVRTGVGRFRLEDSFSLEEIEKMATRGRLADALTTVDEALCDLPSVVVGEEDARGVANGAAVPSERLIGETSGAPVDSPVRVKGPAGRLIAIGLLRAEPTGRLVLKPRKVFITTVTQGPCARRLSDVIGE